MVSRTRREWSGEIWKVSEIATESTLWDEDLSMSFCLRDNRVVAPSEKISLGMGRRPCSKGSRLGCKNVAGEEDDVDGSIQSVISMERESASVSVRF